MTDRAGSCSALALGMLRSGRQDAPPTRLRSCARTRRSGSSRSRPLSIWTNTRRQRFRPRYQPRSAGSPCSPTVLTRSSPSTSTIHSVTGVVEQDGVPIAILGTVLPWSGAIQQAPEFHHDETTVDEVFQRVLGEQVSTLKALAKEHTHVIWAGDFNQSLWGANYGGSTARRRMLLDALAELRMIPFNAALPHASAGMTTIDLICGTKSLQLESARRIAVRDSLSDHSAYVVELSVIK
jgi:Endonuclease-reverse transcriptase